MRAPTKIRIRELNRKDAAAILAWRYPAPFDLYNLQPDSNGALLENLMEPDNRYYSVLDDQGALIAFRCYGSEARVVGGDYSESALDLGGGMRPDLTGHGLGRHVVAAAMNYAITVFAPSRFRCTVASFNLRAVKVCERLGYQRWGHFIRPSDNLEFVIFSQRAVPKTISIPLGDEEQNQSKDPTA